MVSAETNLASITGALIATGQRMDRHGWVPATAGNLSHRLPDGRVAITRSGVHKGRLIPTDIVIVDATGAPQNPAIRPSAETLLHCQLYAQFPAVQAVLHGHSIAATTVSLHTEAATLAFTGYELLKAFGAATHATTLHLPVLDNDQDMPRLAAALAPHLSGARMGYLVRGHGTTIWADTIDSAYDRFEALEFLLACELSRRTLPL